MAFCNQCGSALKDGVKFCNACGKSQISVANPPVSTPPPPLVDSQPAARSATLCIHCGSPLKDGAKFCIRCGKSQVTDQAMISIAPSPPPSSSVPASVTSTPATVVSTQAKTVACIHCGSQLKDGAKFCIACGKSQVTDPAASVVPPPYSPPPAPVTKQAVAPAAGKPSAPMASTPAPQRSASVSAPAAPSSGTSAKTLVVASAVAGVAILGLGYFGYQYYQSAQSAPAPVAIAPKTAPVVIEQPAPVTPAALPAAAPVEVKPHILSEKEIGGYLTFISTDAESGNVPVNCAAGIKRLETEFKVLPDQSSEMAQKAWPKLCRQAAPVVSRKSTPAPKSPAHLPPSAGSDTNQAITGMLFDAEDCMSKKKYECAIANAKSVLRISPSHHAAQMLLDRAQAAQKQALQSITIN